jgi:hypothetical protein
MAETEGSNIYPLSAIDHLSPRSHVPKLLYFESTAEPDVIITTLRHALAETLRIFPLAAGSVGFLEDECQTGSLAVQAPYFTADDILSVKDLREKYDYQTIRAQEFPSDAVGANVLPDILGKPAQVLLAQLNLIRGGLVLVCGVHHCVMDETGIFNLIKVWSTYCHGADASGLVKQDWIDRGPLMKGEGTGRLQDHPEYTLRREEDSATQTTGAQTYIAESADVVDGVILFFSDESLQRLKVLASKADPEVTGEDSPDKKSTSLEPNKAAEGSWISTNDALCALLWCSISSARMAAGTSAETPAVFSMTVNGRSRISPPMSPEFTGNVVLISKSVNNFGNLSLSYPSNLGDIARLIRKSVMEIDHKMIKDIVQMVYNVTDVGRLAPGGFCSYQRNLGCTSWSRQPYYSLDWGNALGGKCKRLRWRKLKTDGIFAIFPHIPADEEADHGGGLEICLGLQREVLQNLRKDAIFNQFATWRCD